MLLEAHRQHSHSSHRKMGKTAQRIVEASSARARGFFAGGWVGPSSTTKAKGHDIATSALRTSASTLPEHTSIGAQFGVVQVRIYGHAYEIVTFRSDNAYVDGRHPTSISFSGPKQDALRRDFTINGLFYDPIAGRLIDHVHGRNDIQRKLIRTIGNPGDRFAEDKLRMLRAIRLACCLGFTIVPESWDAIRKLAPEILQVSLERIRDELSKLLTGPDPATGLDLRDGSLMKHICRKSTSCWDPEQRRLFGSRRFHPSAAVALLRSLPASWPLRPCRDRYLLS
jgi:poly(A) polymerase